MSDITSTRISVPSQGVDSTLPGDFSSSEVVQMFGTRVQGLDSMQSNESTENGVKTLTFSPRQGSKG